MFYLKQSLLLDQHAFLQGPEVEVGLAAGDNDVGVCRVEVCSEHRLVGALNHETRNSKLMTPNVKWQDVICFFGLCDTHTHTYLDFGQSVLSLPVPDGEDVVIGVVYDTQCVSSILSETHKPMFM